MDKVTATSTPPASSPSRRYLFHWIVVLGAVIGIVASAISVHELQSRILAAYENDRLHRGIERPVPLATETAPHEALELHPVSRDNVFRAELENISMSLLITCAALLLGAVSIALLLHYRYIRPIHRLKEFFVATTPSNATFADPRGAARVVRELGISITSRLRQCADANDVLIKECGELASRIEDLRAELVRARDQVLIAAEQKTGFLGLVSHNLRMPLQSILLYTQAVMDRVSAIDDPIAMDDLQTVMRSGKHLLSLIDQILDFSRLESGRATVTREQITVDAFMNSVRDMITPLAQKNGNTLFTNVDASNDEFTSDRDKLLQIALNLLGNSCKYTRQGRVTFNLLCAGDRLTMIVADTGVGMTEEETHNIFTAFFRAKGSSSVSGTGLGLAITERLVRLLNGSIHVDSAVDKGTTFFVHIPLEPSQPAHSSHSLI